MQFTPEIITMVQEQLGYIACVDEQGFPFVGPKRTCRVYGDNKLIWNENTGSNIYRALSQNPKVSIVFVNWGRNKAVRFHGTCTITKEGEAYENCLQYAQANDMKPPKYAVVVEVTAVFDLSPKNQGVQLV